MSIFGDALIGGIGATLNDTSAMMGERIKAHDAEDIQARRDVRLDDLAEKRARTMEELKVEFSDRARTNMVGRIDNAKTGLINSSMNRKYAGSDAAVAAADAGETDAPLTQEQKDVIAQSKQADADKLRTDPKILRQAAINTGDLTVKDVMADDVRAAGVEAKFADIDRKNEIGKLTVEAKNAKTEADYAAKMVALEMKIEKAGGGNTDFDKKIKLLREGGASTTEIANFITDKKQPSMEDLANGFLKSDPMIGTKKALTPEAAYEKAKKLRELSKSIAGDTGENPANSKPKPSAPAGGNAKSPYAEGTQLTGPGGKPYIVKNGVPVPQ